MYNLYSFCAASLFFFLSSPFFLLICSLVRFNIISTPTKLITANAFSSCLYHLITLTGLSNELMMNSNVLAYHAELLVRQLLRFELYLNFWNVDKFLLFYIFSIQVFLWKSFMFSLCNCFSFLFLKFYINWNLCFFLFSL